MLLKSLFARTDKPATDEEAISGSFAGRRRALRLKVLLQERGRALVDRTFLFPGCKRGTSPQSDGARDLLRASCVGVFWAIDVSPVRHPAY